MECDSTGKLVDRMDLVAFSLIAVVLLPMGIGLVVGRTWAYWVWATLVALAVAGQASSGEVAFFTVMVVVLGMLGALGVTAGLAGHRFLRRRAAARARGRLSDGP
jgi:hypothetical protein